MSNDFKSWVIGKYVVADDETSVDEVHYGPLKVVEAFSDDEIVVQISVGWKIISASDVEKGIFYITEKDAATAAAIENGEDENQQVAA